MLNANMQNLKEIHDRMNGSKRERRDLKKRVKEAFAQSKPYQDVLEQMKSLKAKQAQIEAAINREYQQEIDQIENLKKSIDEDAQMLSDVSLSMLMKGETVEIKDDDDTRYTPEFKVRFKKA